MQANQSAVQSFQTAPQDYSYTGEMLVTITAECTIYQEISDIVLDMYGTEE